MSQLKKNELLEITQRVLNQQPNPKTFMREVQSALDFFELEARADSFISALVAHIAATVGQPNDPIRLMFHQWLSEMDSRNVDSVSGWTLNTDPCTQARRSCIYTCLGVLEADCLVLDKQFPVPADANLGFKKDDHQEWYDESRRRATRYYAESLEKYLANMGWSPQNLALVRQSAEYVIANLADPAWAADPQSNRSFAGRGLVVGYVQSGKTTMMNLTIANAVDVGYKLVVVLAGLTDLLRRQTQRRFDKEVAGKLVLEQDHEVVAADGYQFANDWKSFIEHGAPRPGVVPRSIERLTTFKNDYRKAIGNPFPPAWVVDPTSCRVVIIKKNKQRLAQLLKGIEHGISPQDRKKLSVLILDDESDQATINTVDPRQTSERRGINEQIIKLLGLLPQSQYVGVTATPAANCFTDPSDANDIYPRHFILPLARPDGYMGILDFHDLDDELVPLPTNVHQPKKHLHVRDITNARNNDEAEIQAALDSFVLSGAIKLFRQSTGVYSATQKHHTLFYSDSTRVSDMQDAKKRLQKMWDESAYASIAGLTRLEALYNDDLFGRSPNRNDPGYFPEKFQDLTPFIAQAVQRIDQPFDGHGAVLVVNGEKDSAQIDFQVIDIWKIIIGGMKLSRGYTIEGLTVTYFRRKSTNEAALMQMGRWFGYRAGYRDLVRLWISRNEDARPEPVDIYDFFESVCIDEETLRRKFREWYEQRNPDGSRISPIQIRPLISTVDVRLKPVAPNQMWNARLESLSYSGVRSNTAFGNSTDALVHNEAIWRGLLSDPALRSETVWNKTTLVLPEIDHSKMISALESVRRPPVPSSNENELLFLSFLKSKECKISKWTVLIPQLDASQYTGKLWQITASVSSTEVRRGWLQPYVRLKTIGDKADRVLAHVLSDTKYPSDTPISLIKNIPTSLLSLKHQDRGVILLYPTRPTGHSGLPIMAFECVIPNHPPRMGWKVMDPSQDKPVILVQKKSM